MNEKEICELMDKLPTFEGSKPIYNPMETFVECVSQKEICHSSILADLLNPLGRHGLGRSFLDVFLKEIGCESFKDVTIRTEMPVLRILTAGSGPRRIDICIMNNHNKNVVIIENKLNNAQEQQCQLADYKAGLKHNGFNVVKTVCLQGSNFNNIGADINLSIMDLASLLDKVCGNCFELKSYIALLKNMGRKERMKEEVEKLLSLNNRWAGKTFLHHTVVQKAKGSRQYAKRRYEKFVIKFPHRLRLYRLHLYLHDDLIFLQFEERNERPNESYDHRCYKSFRFHMHRVLSFSFPLYFPLSP